MTSGLAFSRPVELRVAGFFDDSTGFAGVLDNENNPRMPLLRTTDQGHSWTEVPPAGIISPFRTAIGRTTTAAVTGRSSAIVVGDGTSLYTGDASFKWWQTQIHTDPGYYGISSNGQTTALLSREAFWDSAASELNGQFDLVNWTTDAGATWAKSPIRRITEPTPELTGMAMAGNGVFFAFGYYGTLFRSGDYGRSWARIEMNDSFPFLSMSFYDSLNGITSARNRVYRTSDGGMTWDLLPASSPSNVMTYMRCFSATEWMAYGYAPDIAIYRTTDAGESWETRLMPQELTVDAAVDFVSMDVGWALNYFRTDTGYTSYVYRTVDGGRSWIPQLDISTNRSTGPVISVDFIDSMHGVVAGPRGRVYWTSTGGQTWDTISIGMTYYETQPPWFAYVAMISPESAFAVSRIDPVYRIDRVVATAHVAVTTASPSLPMRPVTIAPAPARDMLRITLDMSGEEELEIRLVDMVGTERMSKRIPTADLAGNQIRLDIGALPAGIYLMAVTGRASYRNRTVIIAR